MPELLTDAPTPMESSKDDAASGVTQPLEHGVAPDDGVDVATGDATGVGEGETTGFGVGVAPETGEAVGDGLGLGGCPWCLLLLSVITAGSEPAAPEPPPHAGRASTPANASEKKEIGNRRLLSRNLNLVGVQLSYASLLPAKSARRC